MKTGYTDAAGRNLVTSAIRGNVRLIGVVLGSSSNARRSMEMASILDDGFASEGVAPQPLLHPVAPRTVMIASARRGGRFAHHGTMVASSRPVEVADAPTSPRRYGRVAHHAVSVRMVSAHHVAAHHKAGRHPRG